ncbi:MAG: sulfite exporter TauE/SafE family protein [Chthoniobacterales bacterium]
MHIGDFTTAGWLIATLAALCVGMAKTGLTGLGMVAVVLMAQVMPARASTGALLTILITADVFAVIAFRRHAVWPHVLRLLPAALVGIVSGYFLMPLVPEHAFRPLIGWLTLALLGLLIVQRSTRLAETAASHPALALPAGWLGGATTMMANAAGPVMTIYLLACRLPKLELVGTGAWFFFVVNLAKVPFSVSLGLITRDSLLLTAALVPVVVIGALCGRWILQRINQRLFDALLFVFTALAALRLIGG